MIYNIYKPIGWTSFDIVKKVRGITKEKKVGHGGTLDPFAEGVLIIGTGKATKTLSSYSNTNKTYIATLLLGDSTDTMDNEGSIITSKPIPTISKNIIIKTLNIFKGEYKQTPPMYSAKKINGIRLYKLARKNIVIKREPVVVTVKDISLNNFSKNIVKFSVTCSKGTYIRVLGQDIANKLGTEGHLINLVRTRVGDFDVSESTVISDFEKAWKSTDH